MWWTMVWNLRILLKLFRNMWGMSVIQSFKVTTKKKNLMVFSFVLLRDYSLVELSAILRIFMANFFHLIVGRPFKRRLANAVMIFFFFLYNSHNYLYYSQDFLLGIFKKWNDYHSKWNNWGKNLYGWISIANCFHRIIVFEFLRLFEMCERVEICYQQFFKGCFLKEEN